MKTSVFVFPIGLAFALLSLAQAQAQDVVSISNVSSSAQLLDNGNTQITFVVVLSLNVIPIAFNFHWERSDGARTAVRVISVNNAGQQIYRLVETWTVGPSVPIDQLWEKVFVNSGNTHLASNPIMAATPSASQAQDVVSISNVSSSAQLLDNGNTQITFVAVLSLNVIPMSFNFHWERSDGARTAVRVISVNNAGQQTYQLLEKWTVGQSVSLDQLWERVFVNSGNTHLASNPIMAGVASAASSMPRLNQTNAPAVNSGTYKIGDRGPAGGYIFYDKGNSDGGWRYLEVAKEDLSVTDWRSGDYVPTGASDTAIGTGKANTSKIITVQGQGTYAASACVAYSGGGFSDWFLPSKDELDALYKNLGKKGIGGFVSGLYLSSSDDPTYQYAWTEDFGSGFQLNSPGKGGEPVVRPIRQVSDK